jgi:hypothetical protein
VVTNLTNADAVTLDQLNPTLTGNAGEGNPIDPTNPPPPNVYPVAVAPKLGPGEVKALIADVQTVQSQGTRGTVQYKVTGKVEKPDGTKASLSQAQVVYDPKDATETIHIDDSVPTYDPDSKLKAAVANYAIGFAEGEEQWFKSTFDTAAWALKAAPGAILDVQKAPIELLQCIDYYVTYWSYLNVSARLAFIDEIGRGVLAQTDQLGKTIDQVDANIAAKLTSWSNTLETAWDTGDWPDVARSAGRVSGNLAVEAATWEVHLPEAAKLIKLGDAAKEAGVAKRVAEGLRALEAGDELSDAALFELYGIDAEQAAAFRELSQEKGLLIAPRYRNPLSIAWEELGALPKMEAVKLKNVDEIDAAFLEYRSGDVGSVVLKRPLTPAELHATAAYENASPTLKEAADIRLEARQKEWVKFQANEPGYNYSQMAKPFDEGGGVTVPESYQGWNYKANGSALPAPDPTVAIKRRFEMAQVGNEEYWVLKAADRNGVLQRITGDIDIVAITKANGQLLSPAEKLDIYRNLQDTVGMQHGDTFNWLENGELLQDHLPGREPLVVFDPTGAARANFIQPKYTFFNSADKQGRIWYVGGYRNPRNTVSHFGQLAFPMFQQTTTAAQPWLTAAGWGAIVIRPPSPKKNLGVSRKHGAVSGSYSILGGTCTWQYSAARNAGVVYPDQRGGLMQWSKGPGWRMLNIDSCWYPTKPASGSPLGSDHVLRLLPQTSLQAPATKGARSLTINGVDNADPQLKASSTAWFKVGQHIVLDPGAKDQQIATITKVHLTAYTSVLTIAQPLLHGYLGGIMVSVS